MKITCSSIAKASGLKFNRRIGRENLFHCPNHDDDNASLTINNDKNVWLCGPCGVSGGAWAFAQFVSGLSNTRDLVEWLVDRKIMEERNRPRSKYISSYTYKDIDGKDVLLVKKFVANDGKKSFAQYHKDEKGEWIAGVNGIKLYPYRINEWKDKPVVYIVEGEKDADALWMWGIPGTTNPCGAGSWKEEFNEYFKGKRVAIIPDNDEVGQKHAKKVLSNLVPVAIAVKLVNLPNLPPKGDFSDWVTKCGGTKELFSGIVRATEWSTLADAGLCEDPEEEAKILVRRINYDIADFFEKVAPEYDKAWVWMKDNEDLWSAITDAERKLDESCSDRDPVEIIKNRCLEYKVAFKNAISKFLEFVGKNK